MRKLDINTLLWYCEHSPMCMQKHPFADLYIFGYYRDSIKYRYQLWDETNSICRGLITDLKGNIVQRPFAKFWTYRQYLSDKLILLSEGQTKLLDSPVKAVYEKVDGTMGILYWVDEVPYIASQRSFTNARALKGTQILHEKYAQLFSRFDRSLTYVFEIIYDETAIVVKYDMVEELILIGLIETTSGRSLPLESCNPGFRTCEDLTLKYGGLAEELGKLESLDLANAEGLVVHYEDDSRVKIKFPWFQKAHGSFARLLAQRKQLAITEHSMFPAGPTACISRHDIMNWAEEEFQSALACSGPIQHMLGFDYWMSYWFNRRTESVHIPGFEALVGDVFDTDERLAELHLHETQTWKWRKHR